MATWQAERKTSDGQCRPASPVGRRACVPRAKPDPRSPAPSRPRPSRPSRNRSSGGVASPKRKTFGGARGPQLFISNRSRVFQMKRVGTRWRARFPWRIKWTSSNNRVGRRVPRQTPWIRPSIRPCWRISSSLDFRICKRGCRTSRNSPTLRGCRRWHSRSRTTGLCIPGRCLVPEGRRGDGAWGRGAWERREAGRARARRRGRAQGGNVGV